MEKKGKVRLYPETIIIERMYAGGYLNDNIGHEIINTVKTDAGENYIYVSPWGVVNPDYQNTKYVLLVRLITQHCFEVIGYAGDLELLLSSEALKCAQKDAGAVDSDLQLSMIQDNSISYGGIPLNELLAEQENVVFVTFRAKTLRFVKGKQKIYIVDEESEATESHFFIDGINFSKQSLKMYVPSDKKAEAFTQLQKLIETEEYWEPENSSLAVVPDECSEDTTGFLDVIGKTYDELAHSNWLAYYLQNDLKLLRRFAEQILQISDFNATQAVLFREYHNIDLWMETKEHVVVIENKIKSGINGVDENRHDLSSERITSQLSKYVKFAESEAKREGLNRSSHFYIFLPNYSKNSAADLKQFEESEKYTIIHYSMLADFFDSQESALPFYDEFRKALRKHAANYQKDLRVVMEERFARKINAKISEK